MHALLLRPAASRSKHRWLAAQVLISRLAVDIRSEAGRLCMFALRGRLSGFPRGHTWLLEATRGHSSLIEVRFAADGPPVYHRRMVDRFDGCSIYRRTFSD